MPGGIENSQQFIGVTVRKPYSEEYGPVLQKYSDTEGGIAQAHGHADALAEKLSIPREAIRVSRYGSSTSSQVVTPDVPRPAKKPAKKTSKSKTPSVPSLNEAVITKGKKSTKVKLGE